VTLPDIGAGVANRAALHIFGMSVRNTTTGTVRADGSTLAAPAGQTWTGAWANPTEGQYNYEGGANYSNMTFRVALKPSISGNTVRIKLDDALGGSKLVIGRATVARAAGSPSAVPTGTISTLTFGGATGVTIPAGGMVYSDPLSFAVTANQYLLVSFSLTNSVPFLVQHSWANTAHIYVSAPGSGDHTADTTAAAFTGTNTHDGWFSDVLTDLDVTTGGVTTQAVLGDGLIDAWQPNTAPTSGATLRLSDDLAADEPTTAAPYGTIAEGIESNHLLKDNPETYNGNNVGGPSALSRIDRDILDQPGLNTVVLYQGLNDLLNGASADDLDRDGYSQLLSYMQANTVDVIAVGLTPCDGYGGDGATGNSTNDRCTDTVDDNRIDVNSWLSGFANPQQMSPGTHPAMFYIDADAAIGILDTDSGRTKLDPHAGIATDHVNLTDPGYAALATAYLGPQNSWQLGDGVNPTDGTIDTNVTDADDSASNLGNPYLKDNLLVGARDATLAGGAGWAFDPTRGGVLSLDGATGTADTNGSVLDTSGSYSVSAWVKMTNTTTYNTIASQEPGAAGTVPAFYLQYSKSVNAWNFVVNKTSTGGGQVGAHATTAPALNTWTHLVGVYNAATHSLSLYVNGALAATASYTTPWNATGNFDIGHAGASNYFPGQISTLQAWNYALTGPQVTALFQQI
jgi:hypothetical protein